MANITTVDYEAMPGQAARMRTTGQAMNSELTQIYEQVTNMRSNWYGKRYNELTVQFNNLIPTFNEMLKLVITEIPFALETIANNYAHVDGTSVAAPQQVSPQTISEISPDSSVGMRFITGEVENTRNTVVSKFQNTKEQMQEMSNILASVTWQSEASEAFRSRFNTLKSQIDSSIEEINKTFTNLMRQALDDMEATEKANTVQ